ncbi:hypothetical protein GCM10027514_10820 [Azotobacter armeniacus]
MARNDLSFGADAGGRVSIDPEGNKAKFPVYIFRAEEAVLDISVAGNGEHDLSINKCISSKIEPISNEVLHVPDPINSNLILKDEK